jgi:Tfp pilus assembly protein PilF
MKHSFRKKIKPHLIPASILILVTFAVYMGILGHDFQLFWDDEKYVTANAAVKGFSLEHLRSAFTTNYMGNYAPFQIISYMLDYTVWGMNATGFLLSNIVLHICNGILFYAILIRLGWSRLWASFSVFVFLLHPVQVESVAWISERKNLLAMFFYLAAFASYLSYRNKGWGEGKGAYLASFAFFVLALMSKSVAVIFPFMLVLYDICCLEKGERSRWRANKIPFFCATAVMAWVTIQGQLPGEMPGAGGGRIPYHGGSPFATFLTMMTVLVRYLKLLFWPTGLSAVYDPPIRTGFDGVVVGCLILVALLVVAGVMLFRRDCRLFFWYGLFFIGLLPVAQIVPIVTLMNDRYLYFPMLGAAAFFGALACLIDKYSGVRSVIGIATAGLILIALPWLTFARAGVWKDDLTLWSDAAKKAPNHYVALYGLAQALQNSGDLDAALPLYIRVLAINPRHLDTLDHLGALYRARKMPKEGRSHLLTITRYYPNLAKGFVDLGMNYYQTDELGEAEKAFRRGLELDPRSKDAIYHLGMISLRTRRLDSARGYFQDIIIMGGMNADVEYNLACVEALSGHPDEALRHLEDALKLGFRDKESIMKDRDLDAIRKLPGFQKLMLDSPG